MFYQVSVFMIAFNHKTLFVYDNKQGLTREKLTLYKKCYYIIEFKMQQSF